MGIQKAFVSREYKDSTGNGSGLNPYELTLVRVTEVAAECLCDRGVSAF